MIGRMSLSVKPLSRSNAINSIHGTFRSGSTFRLKVFPLGGAAYTLIDEADVRDYWTDHLGKIWKVPTIRGRLKCGRVPCHKALREFVIHRDGNNCRICGASDDLIADHVVSRRNGGSHHPDNLQCLCQSCNSRKGNLVDAKGVA